jgi:uncharacterized membrane protein YgcG
MPKVGDLIELQKQNVEVIKCNDCGHLMVNIDADQIAPGDLVTLKRLGLRLSNPETKEAICLNCEVPKKPTFRDKLDKWFEDKNEDDDSDFFHYTPSIPSVPSTPIFGGSSFGGGFGGFGGGMFSGGGTSRGF